MKKTITYLLLLLLTAMVACRDNESGQEMTSPYDTNAALKLYCQYADNENLTVAYLGDFEINGNPIDAVMIQADNDLDWQELSKDFDLFTKIDSCVEQNNISMCPNRDELISLGIGIETDFLQVLGLDSTITRDQITEEHINTFSKYLSLQIKDILNNFQDSDTLIHDATIIIGDDPVTPASNMSIDEYINTVAEVLTQSIFDEFFTNQDSLNLAPDPIPENNKLLDDAKSHGHSGYVTAADYKNRTMWLFFYDDQEECNVILTHIKNDIIVASYNQ
jgi:hypothetical protein